jgi:hypothetical protein
VGNYSATVMHNRGATDGQFDNQNCLDDTAFLDFGQPARDASGSSSYSYYGTYLTAAPYYYKDDSWIVGQVLQYIDGWYHATNSCPALRVVIGTSNYSECYNSLAPCTTNAAGMRWADVRDAVYHSVVTNHEDAQVKVWAGDDIETQGGSWDAPAMTRPFVDGYNSEEAQSDPGEFLDYGNWFPGYSWTVADEVYVSYGARLNWPYAEGYSQYMVDQWTNLAITNLIQFRGVMGTGAPYPAGAAAFNLLDADLVSHGIEARMLPCTYLGTHYCDTTILYQ